MTGARYRGFLDTSSLQGGNAAYVEAQYEQFLNDPEAVDAQWRAYFRGLQGQDAPAEVAHSEVVARFEQLARQPAGRRTGSGDAQTLRHAEKQAGVLRLINYHRVRGRQAARLDPLGLAPVSFPLDLDPAYHGLGPEDMDTVFSTGSLSIDEPCLPLRDILRLLRKVYTDTIGVQFMYLTETEEKRWIQRRMEPMAFRSKLSLQRRREVLLQLVAAEGLERYLHRKYVGQKRFSLEGGDVLIPALDEVLHACAVADVDEVVIGMAHRGRLNVLVNILGKSPRDLFAEFEGKYSTDALKKAGDVKYHMGFSTDVEVDGKRLHLALAFNPSHLEIVNPVVEGSVKARQVRRGNAHAGRVVPVLIHGDAAVAGQGVVMETLQLSRAQGYGTGGTVHIVINNQIGFTTPNPIAANPNFDARTSHYCTDVAKMLDTPVFHVNGDDPEAVVFVTRLAMDYRNQFHKDVFVDICCYRRLGHNEADEPSVTSPLMYETIRKHPTTLQLYARRLEEEGIIAAGEAEAMAQRYRQGLDDGENIARVTLGLVGNQHTVDWHKYTHGNWDDVAETTVTRTALLKLANHLLEVPKDFSLHDRLHKVYQDRARMAAGELAMDWGFAETMAYATLLNEGFNVRLSGQDSRRGTFFHRHATIYDAKTGAAHTALQTLAGKGRFDVNDTLLSEEGVLGFEYGYATTDPQTLVIWEAQFGDFANGAQVLFDQFISSGFAKWGRACGLVVFLPHGYEGQGPEHSSARLERHLQLCAENNQQVCVPSTPAQMFHLLRRQMKRALRLPLIVMTPKSLLRHPLSVSSVEDLTERGFQPVIAETEALDPAAVTRIVFCSGKVYFDLLQARQKQAFGHVALVRVEQLYPFPRLDYEAILDAYPKAAEIVWCQEEPENQGAWYQIKHRLVACLRPGQRLLYATRPGSATTAVGYLKVHQMQQETVVNDALTGGKVM